jgi:hypothetical protein
MSTDWNFAYLVPHAGFKEPIEYGPLALVPPDDERLLSLAQASPAVQALTSRFTDQFARPVTPSAILIRKGAPSTVDFYAVVGFRNAIAISSVIDGHSFRLSKGTAGYPLWSDYFDFYAFTATKDDDLMASSVASTEVDLPGDFVGQRAPHLPSSDRINFRTDLPVLDGCLRNWDRRFIQDRREWKTRVLFRSLEMATQASRVPAVGTRKPTIHDIGASIALWVSAFAVLSHQRSGKANLMTVLDLLAKAEWEDTGLKATRFKVKYQGKTSKINLIQKLYCELYRARNDFLHGNPVTPGKLFPMSRWGGPTLLHAAPLIYRAALMGFLPFKRPPAKKGDVAAQVAAYMTVSRTQSRYERAVASCKPKAT